MSFRFKLAIGIGICLDCILIALLVIWLNYSKSAAEFDMLAQEMQKKEEMYNALLREMNDISKGLSPDYSGDVVLSVSNIVLDNMEKNLFPIEFKMDEDDEMQGVIRGEKLSDFQFVRGGIIQFRISITGRDLVYNPRGRRIIDRMLAGMEIKKKIKLEGSGEISFSFNEEKQRLEMHYDIAGIDFKTGFPQFVEKKIKEYFANELKKKPQYVQFDFKPLKVRFGGKTAYGYYHVTDVITRKNRLMAVADLQFRDSEQENEGK